MKSTERMAELISAEMKSAKVSYDQAWANVKATAEGKETIAANAGTSEGVKKGWLNRRGNDIKPLFDDFASKFDGHHAASMADFITSGRHGKAARIAKLHGDLLQEHIDSGADGVSRHHQDKYKAAVKSAHALSEGLK